MKKVEKFAAVLFALLPLLFPFRAEAQSDDQKIQQLEQKLEQLDQEIQAIKVADRKAELKAEEDAAKEKTGAHVTADTEGFAFRSNDGNFWFKIGADVQMDSRNFFGP